MPGSLPKIAELAAGLPQVTGCYRITGESCFIIKPHAPAIGQPAGRAVGHRVAVAILAGEPSRMTISPWS